MAAIERLSDSAGRGELVAVIGTGVSISLASGRNPALSWKGLIENGFAYGVRKGKIKESQANDWKAQLSSPDVDDLLAAAEFVGRKLGAPSGDLYARWLQDAFRDTKPVNTEMQAAIRSLQSAGVPLCTLNYDTLLERALGLDSINLSDTDRVADWMRRDSDDILHLHGTWSAPESCILGIRDYEGTLGNDVRDLIQRSLASFRRLLFIGCSGTFADPNFSALIAWLRTKMKTATPQHYALVTEAEVAERHADPAWHGFVEPLSYGVTHTSLPPFITTNFSPLSKTVATPPKSPTSGASEQQTLLNSYRAFLLRDCGQMTIEGVRADLDTAQRKFDLERLFVPLKVIASPPEFAENDPEREQKLQRWQKRNGQARDFGKTFTKATKLALLALPGGGKTLLLKRLAVAYADPARREASPDKLPDIDVFPVMIRCREWRDHIHLPILTLLKNLPDITGQTSLTGLVDALLPLLEQGRVLLLVDGLDEIHDDGRRSVFVDNLETFIDQYKKNRLIVTSREAGFSLVAPILARFCKRWRVAPLEDDAIAQLCGHWHSLMGGDSPETRVESKEVSEHLIRNYSLRRLAENPLLLTMLLVVKHGAGRLPPDRVTLYSRAVEVLLDTWNIKGHAPLNTKEAVPQLAFIAYELMRAGKQTATERELLELLDKARDTVPIIRRYAIDTPDAFLKRVELRSSLLIEAGLQVEKNSTVPFYQFRHLTFQEYLAGVAVTEGHYAGYKKKDTVLTPLSAYLTIDEWKEVIPVAAVLARKQAEPLIASLVAEGERLRKALVAGRDFPGRSKWSEDQPPKLPPPVARLVQCLIEEAEATSETLIGALRLTALFAIGCRSEDDWAALCRGPYGQELMHQAWLLYQAMDWPDDSWLLHSCITFAFRRHPSRYWISNTGKVEIERMLTSTNAEEIVHGLFISTALYFYSEEFPNAADFSFSHSFVEAHLFTDDPSILIPAVWAWALARHRDMNLASRVDVAVLNRIATILLNPGHPTSIDRAAFALTTVVGTPRAAWTPTLTDSQVSVVKQRVADGGRDLTGALVLAFYAANIWPDSELAARLTHESDEFAWMVDASARDWMLHQLTGPKRKTRNRTQRT